LDETIDLWRTNGCGQGTLVSGDHRGAALAKCLLMEGSLGQIPRLDVFIQSLQLGEGAIHGPDRGEGAG